jgi:sugar phosphate isomerase/epimerase
MSGRVTFSRRLSRDRTSGENSDDELICEPKMKLAFSTLGCPQWELDRIVQAAIDLGYEGIELRALGGELNLLGRPEFQPHSIEATRRRLGERNLSVCCVDTSCAFHSRDAAERSAQVEIAVRHCELAAALGATLVRIFPDKIQPGASREETRDNIAACLGEVARRAAGEVRIGLETHGDFARGREAAEIARLADHPKVALIWDVANALAAGDPIEETAREVAPYLAHVHLRDARAIEGREHWLPVLAGRGAVSFAEAVEALRKLGYDGFISFEWEKYWHPEIEEPDVALPDFAIAIRQIFGRSAGKRSETHQAAR